MKKRTLVFAVMLSALVSPSVLGQKLAETVEVRIVEVPVTVVDRSGKPVLGLTRDDFEITDDGKKVNIVGFEVLDMNAMTVEDNSTPMPPAAYRNFLLLFDLANSSPGTLGRAQEAAKEFVGKQMGRRDLGAVATFSVEQGLQVVTSFTSDRATLEHAVATLGQPKYFKVADPLRIAPPSNAGQLPTSGREQEAGGEIAIGELLEYNEQSSRVNDQELRGRLRRQFTQLGNVARMLDSLSGQKQIILLSEGFDSRLVQGREDLSFQATQRENDAVLSGEIWNVDTEARYGSSASTSEIGQMAEIFRRSDVTMHAIDIKGLRTDVDASAGLKKGSTEALHLLTRPTGGEVFKNASALSENFARLLKQQEVVYLLAFEARGESKGKFRSLKVKVPAARGAKVNHRSGYYESSAKSSPLQQTLTLADIMMTDADVREVPFSVFSVPLPMRNGGARLPVVVEIPGESLLRDVTGNTLNATIFVYAFDEQYQIKDFIQQRVGFDLAKSGAALRAAGMRYVGMLEVPPGTYAIKTLTRVEESGRVGFLRSDVVVPGATGPAILPPVFVSDRPGWINVAQPGRGASAMAAFTAAGKAFVPAIGPTLKAEGSYRVALFLHDTSSDDLSISPVVLDASGASQAASVTLVGRTPADAEGTSKVLLEFKPATIAAGPYQLQLTVQPKEGKQSVVAVPFRIE